MTARRRPVYDIDCFVPQAIQKFEPANNHEIVAREILMALSEPCEVAMCGIIRKTNVVTVAIRIGMQRRVSFYVKPYSLILNLRLDTDTESNAEWDHFDYCDPGFFESVIARIFEFVIAEACQMDGYRRRSTAS